LTTSDIEGGLLFPKRSGPRSARLSDGHNPIPPKEDLMATEHNVSPPTAQGAPESPEPAHKADADREQAAAMPASGSSQTADADREQAAAMPASGSSREADADVVVDVPQLSVDELNLELHAPILEQVKLEAKGLQVGLFAKVGLDNVVAIAGKRPARRLPDIEGQTTSSGEERQSSDAQRAAERQEGVRDELEHLLDSAKQAYEKVADRDPEEQVRDVYEAAREAYARITGRAEDGGGEGAGGGDGAHGGEQESRAEAAGRRALEIAKQGGKAAGLTAAGMAGGAALESMRRPGRNWLPLPTRRGSGPKAVIEKVKDRLG
jgi:hypothetical protein